ncbi:MAG TPA: hypothetical protein VNA88_14135 [Candidatus Kapabacteria bacterium]|jgi:hypothetical protein|nr:hypothetical protein [Candidatus Kapabacteria bacterium]
MKTLRLAMAALGLLLPGFLPAQQGAIRIKQGETLEYNVRAEFEVTEVVGDREAVLRAVTGGVAELHARRVTRQKIEWSYETPEVKLVRVTSTMEPGASTETMVQAKAGRLATDGRGRVVAGLRAGRDDASLTAMMEAMHRSLVRLWFQPTLLRGKRPGDTWSEKRDERLRIAEMGIDVRARYTVVYRFDGIIDTLGGKAVRISWSAEEMAIDGTRTIDGVVAPVLGDGDHQGSSYYSTIDGLLLASSSENVVDIRVSPGDGGGVIPMTWRLRSESTRR